MKELCVWTRRRSGLCICIGNTDLPKEMKADAWNVDLRSGSERYLICAVPRRLRISCTAELHRGSLPLKTKARTNAKSGSNARKRIISAGEIFADGTMIELVSGSSGLDKPDFLLWNGKKASVGTHIKHGGRTYEVPELGPSLYRATRFPSRCDDYDSARDLFAAIADLLMLHLDLPERESSLLTCFSISTWLADRLPTAPSLAISGPDQELGIDVLRLLSCVCRHPLMLAEVTPVGFRSLRHAITPYLASRSARIETQHAATFPRIKSPWTARAWNQRKRRRSLWSDSDLLRERCCGRYSWWWSDPHLGDAIAIAIIRIG